MKELNPVEQNVMELADQYLVFSSDPDATLLIWQVDQDTEKMIQTMLTFHTEDTALFSDLTLPADTAFEEPEFYQREIADKLIEDFEASKEDIEDDPLKQWNPAKAAEGTDPLLSYLSALAKEMEEIARHITIYFRPTDINDMEGFALWLKALMKKKKDPKIQFMAFDDEEGTLSKALSKPLKKNMMVLAPVIDMNKTIEETFAKEEAEAKPGPEKDYRHYIVHAVTALRRQDHDKAFDLAGKAFAIAEKQKWPDMQMTSLLVYGNAILNKEDHDFVVRTARQAQRIAADNPDFDTKPVLDNLLLQSFFLEANALMFKEDWEQAAKAYVKAADVARELKNALMEFEARRMATRCFTDAGDYKAAWETGDPAFLIAGKFPDELKLDGTFPDFAWNMKRLSEQEEERRDLLDEHMVGLLGDDWEKRLKQAA